MSTNLEWSPVPKSGKSLSTSLKWAMQKRYDGYVSAEFNSSDVSYFEGLRDAGIEDAEEVIAAIEKHGTIIIKEV